MGALERGVLGKPLFLSGERCGSAEVAWIRWGDSAEEGDVGWLVRAPQPKGLALLAVGEVWVEGTHVLALAQTVALARCLCEAEPSSMVKVWLGAARWKVVRADASRERSPLVPGLGVDTLWSWAFPEKEYVSKDAPGSSLRRRLR